MSGGKPRLGERGDWSGIIVLVSNAVKVHSQFGFSKELRKPLSAMYSNMSKMATTSVPIHTFKI